MIQFKTTNTARTPRSVITSLMIRRSSEAVLSISLETSPQEEAEVEAVVETEVGEVALSETEVEEVAVVVATEVVEVAVVVATEVAEGVAEVVEVAVTSHLLPRTANSRL